MSAALSAIGIATSSLTRVRWVRVLLMVVFGFFVYSFGSYALILLLLGFLGGPFASSGAGSFTLFMFTWAAMLAALVPIGVAFAADRIAHRETSTSTPLRVVASSIALLGALVDVVWISTQGSDHSATIVALVCALLAFPLMWVVAERETLPLAVRALPPRAGWRGWLAIPHLAGGGRGALLASLTIGFVCAVHFVACVTEHGKLDDDAVAGLAYGAFTWWYLLLPSGLLAPFSARPGVTGITRVAIVFVPLLLLLGTVLLGAMLSLRPPAPSVLDAVNPSALVRDLRSNGQPSNSGPWIALGLIVTVTFFLNVWRMLRGVREVRRVQREHAVRSRGDSLRAA